MPLNPPLPDRSNGQTIDETWFNLPKADLTDHENRITALEGQGYQFQFKVPDFYYDFATASSLPVTFLSTFKILEDITLQSGQLWIESAGSSGTTEIDIYFKRGAGAWTSIFTTKPSVAFSLGDYAVSVNGVLNVAWINLLAGDLLRMDVTNMQVDGRGFASLLDYIRA